MVPLRFPGTVKDKDLESFRRRSWLAVHEARLVGTMSHTICDGDIVGLLECPATKVRVVPSATPDDLGTAAEPSELLAAVPAASRPFLLYPAAWRPYKNHAALVEALACVRRHGHPDMQLILTGFKPLPAELASVATRLGISEAVHASATGKAMLAWLPENEIHRILALRGMARLTQATFTDPSALIEELRHVRRNGFALDREECQPGVTSIAAVIRNHTGAVICSLSASAPAFRADDGHVSRMRDAVMEAARLLSADLGAQAACAREDARSRASTTNDQN